jgi:NAD(P)H-hydrate epimerase
MSFESAVAAARAGAGLTTLCVPEEAKCAYQARVKETMLNFLPSKNGKIVFDESALQKIIANSNSIAVGMGMGKSDDTAKIVSYLAKNFDGTLVIDADGLNSIADETSAIENATANLILTPHIGEFNRLERSSGELVERAKNLAKKLNAVIAVKSATTIITDGNEVYFNLTGTPALAKGGSGDVLAGITAALSCVLSPLKAAVSACYHFGKAAERAVKRLNSETSVLASDVIIELDKE